MSVREYRFGPSKASCPKCPVSSQVRPRLLFLLLSVFLLDFPPLPRTRSSFFPKAQHQTILCTCVSKQYCHLFLSATSSPSSSCCEPLWTDSLDSPDAVVCMAPINSARLCAEGPTRDSLSPSTVLFGPTEEAQEYRLLLGLYFCLMRVACTRLQQMMSVLTCL